MATPTASDDTQVSTGAPTGPGDTMEIGPDGKPRKSQKKTVNFDQLDPSQQGLAMIFFFLAMLLDPKMLEGSGLDKIFGSILGLDPNKGESFGRWQQDALKSGKSAPEIARGHDYSKFNFGEAALLAASDTPILELIGKHESGGDYNNYYGRNKNKKGEQVDFSKMSIDQVLAWQHDHTKNDGFASSAAGKYQIIEKTLLACKTELKLSGNEKFDPAMQDRLAVHLLNKRGYQDFLKGEIGAEEFARNLSQEWASLPKDASGLSYYHGDGLNKAGVSWGTLLSAVQSSRNTVRSPSFETQAADNAAKGGALTLSPPIDSVVTSGFGARDTGIANASRDHHGIDLRAAIGTPLVAQAPVQVAYSGPSSGYGNVAILNHGNGVFTVYGHIESDGLAKTGTVLQKGQAFAKSGNEGVGNAPHLHYEILLQGKDGRVYNVNPEKAFGKNLNDPQIREALIADAGNKISRVFNARVPGDLRDTPAQIAQASAPQAPQTPTAPTVTAPAAATVTAAATTPAHPAPKAPTPPAEPAKVADAAPAAAKPTTGTQNHTETSFSRDLVAKLWKETEADRATVATWFNKAVEATARTAEAKPANAKPEVTANTDAPSSKQPPLDETHPAIAAAKRAPATPAPA